MKLSNPPSEITHTILSKGTKDAEFDNINIKPRIPVNWFTLSEKLSPTLDLLQPPKELISDWHTVTDRQTNYFCIPACMVSRSPV